MTYKIISDSSADLTKLDNVAYSSIPLKIITNEREYVDDIDLDVNAMITDLKNYKGAVKSSCPNISDWEKAFENHDGIICVTMTSALSGSNNAANLALSEHLSRNSGKNGFVVDTLSAGPECALIVEKIRELISDNCDPEKIKEKINEYKAKTHLIFSLSSLTNLANNGRVSHAIAKIAGILGIRIIGKASPSGQLEVIEKIRGTRKNISEILSNMIKSGYTGGNVRIHHCQNIEDAESLADIIKTKFQYAKIKISETRGLCSFYAEAGGLLVGFEGAPA